MHVRAAGRPGAHQQRVHTAQDNVYVPVQRSVHGKYTSKTSSEHLSCLYVSRHRTKSMRVLTYTAVSHFVQPSASSACEARHSVSVFTAAETATTTVHGRVSAIRLGQSTSHSSHVDTHRRCSAIITASSAYKADHAPCLPHSSGAQRGSRNCWGPTVGSDGVGRSSWMRG